MRPSGREPVNSPSRITLENNGKIRPQPDRENAFAGASGGEGGIRTHGGRKPTTVFETAPIDHSGTSPRLGVVYVGRGLAGIAGRRKPLNRSLRAIAWQRARDGLGCA